MSRYSRGFFAAMEDDEPIVDVNIQDGVPGDVERDVADAVDEGDEIHDDVEALEDALDSIEEIEAISDAATQSVEEGEGLDPVAAEIAEVAVESIYRRLGMPKHVKAMPSMESFGSSNSRRTATRIAIEGFGAQIKAIWAKVVAFFKSIYEKVVSFFKGLWNANEGVSSLLKGLKGKIKNLEETPKEVTFLSKRVGSAFSKGEGSSFKDKAIDILNNHAKATVSGISAVNKIKSIISKINASDFVGPDAKKSNAEITEGKAGLKALVSEKLGGKTEENDIISGPLVYGNTMVFQFKEESIELEYREGSEGGEEKVGVLSKRDMESLIDSALALSTETEKYKATIPLIKYNNDEVAKLAAQIAEAVDKIDHPEGDDAKKLDADIRESLAKYRTFIVQLGNITVKISTSLPSKNVQACKEAAAYVSDSMKQYKAAA